MADILSPIQKDDLEDEGHKQLIEDLKALLAEAEAKEFHDFENKKYPAPKQALMGALSLLMARVEQGWYDN